MRYEIAHGPAFTTLEFVLDGQESVVAQPDAMLAMSTGITISARIGGQISRGGVVGGVRSMLSGESFFSTTYTSKRDGERITLAPEAVGDILTLEITPERGMYLTRGAFLACEPSLDITAQYGGFKSLISKKGLFLLSVAGTGRLFVQSYGAVIRKELAAGERFVVDNRYVLAFSHTVSYLLVKASEGLKDSLVSGEGLVNRYEGPGEIFYQTRSRQRSGGVVSSMLSMAT
jgi:uncharacterized protein (TIGR00266 family)